MPIETVGPFTREIGGEGTGGFAGIFDAILQDAAVRAFMETEGMYTATEEAFGDVQRELRDILYTVPADQQADAAAQFLRESGFSSDVITQALDIPKEEVNAALMAAGYDVTGQPLSEEDVFEDTTKDDMPTVDLVPEDPDFVTDDPGKVWEDTDKDELDLKGFIDLAFDVFGAYNKDAITNVVDLVNQRGISVGEVAQATGNSVESINQAAAESGTAIENQETGEPITVQETGGPFVGPTIGDTEEPEPEPEDGTVGPGDDVVTPETPIQIPQTPGIPEPSRQGMLAIIQSTPVTEQMFSKELFEPKFRELDNVAQALGMIQSIGGQYTPMPTETRRQPSVLELLQTGPVRR